MKKQALWVLPIAAAFALTGCGGASDNSAGSNGGDEAKALTAEQTTTVVKSLVGDDSDAKVLDSETLKSALPDSKKLIEQMNIKPEKCAELVTQQGTEDLDGINMAVAMITSGGTASTTYSVAGYEDTAKLDKTKEMAEKKDMQGCDKFTMSMSGQEISASAKILDASSDADTTIATQTSMTVNGQEFPGGAYQIQGLVGNNAVVIAYSGGDGSESEADVLKKLTTELNKGVAKIKETAK
ncbi:hypothetical protein [Glutamicibacter sp. JC586]|uniref:hypothetical protein n=1 Tax=Glutamicibacter sp. JC586 TaxID=2590552 RepID=UPI0013587D90|nr:hypothetical protein [Glutamicibacter sp. JC586]